MTDHDVVIDGSRARGKSMHQRPPEPRDDLPRQLLFGVLGVTLGGFTMHAVHSHLGRNAKKSRTEKENPALLAEVQEAVEPLLNTWKPPRFDYEDDFTDHLARYLRRRLRGFKIEVRVQTEHGYPDILIDDILVLELKFRFKKTEADRCVGQCARFAKEWATWVVAVDFSNNDHKCLQAGFEASNLGHIAIFSFS